MDLHLQWYKTVLMKRYAAFSGRAGKREFWTFALINMAISIIFNVLSNFLSAFTYVALLYSLAVLIPGVAVVIRRLHDIGKSGWWYLIALVPFGIFYLLYLMIKDSEPGPNKYGEQAPQEPEIV